jgi:hypothetical protein
MTKLRWVEVEPTPDPEADMLLDMLDRLGRLADNRCPDCGKHLIGTSCPQLTHRHKPWRP